MVGRLVVAMASSWSNPASLKCPVGGGIHVMNFGAETGIDISAGGFAKVEAGKFCCCCWLDGILYCCCGWLSGVVGGNCCCGGLLGGVVLCCCGGLLGDVLGV